MPVYLPGCSRSAFLCAFLAADMLSIFVPAWNALQATDAPVSRRSAVRTALSALVVAPAAAMAADNSGNYDDDPGGYQAPPGIPGFQAGPSFGPGYQKDGTRSVVASTTEVNFDSPNGVSFSPPRFSGLVRFNECHPPSQRG